MARDFDIRRNSELSENFRRKPNASENFRRKPNANENFRAPFEQPTKLQPAAARPTRSKTRGKLPLTLGIIGLAAAAIGAYYWSTLPVIPTVEQNSSTDQSVPPATTPTTENNAFEQDDKLIVQIYQSGASQEAIDQVVNLLKAQDFTVENLGNSQFEYDKTYIWHTPKHAEEAKKIGDSFVGRTISYKESQNAGVFDILIYLGKQ